MKARILYILIGIIAFAGCTKNNTECSVVSRTVTIVAENDDTKTGLDGSNKMVWSEGDKVDINGGEFAATPGTNSTQFEGVPEADTYTVVYPAAMYDHAKKCVTVPVAQTYVSNSFANNAVIMAGYAENKTDGKVSVRMKSAYAYIKMNFSADIEKIILESNGGEAITGIFGLNVDEGSIEMTAMAGQNALHLTGISGHENIIVAIPAQEYSEGLRLVLKDGTGYKEANMWKTSGKTFAANTIYDVTAYELDLSACAAPSETLISTAGELNSWLASPTTDAILVNDIEYDDTANASFESCTSLAKTLDGQGFSIKYWKANGRALIDTNAGTVKNMVIDASCSLTLPASLSGDFGFIVKSNHGTVSGCTNHADCTPWKGGYSAATFLSLMVGQTTTANSIVKNCVNTGNLSLQLTGASGSQYIGMVSGRLNEKTAKILNCVNKGSLQITVDNSVETPIGVNFYIGGVTGASNSGSYTQGCINYGAVSFSAPQGEGAAMVMAGITGYSGANLDDCTNYGNITYTTGGNIKGTMVAGIAAYISGTVKNAHNYGNVFVEGGNYAGRNTIGNYSTADPAKAKSTATTLVGGVVGGGAPTSASSFKFEIQNCSNHGDVTWGLVKEDGAATASAGRHTIGGIVGDSSGPVSNCINEGNVTAYIHSETRVKFTAANSGDTAYVGGIAGSNYYSCVQMELETRDCINRGNVSLSTDNDFTTTYNIGGIIGWPGTETSNTSYRRRCKNYGKVYYEGPSVSHVGGITGNSGNLEDCENYGDVELKEYGAESTKKHCVGGITGFHSGGYAMTGCKNAGSILSNAKATGGISGMVGLFGNSTLTLGENCAVNCTITSTETNNVGMMIGGFNGTSKAISFTGVKVKGTLNGTVLTAENFSSFLHGAINYSSSVHTISGEFGE